MDAALRTGAAFAVVPCCVFPSLFAWRRLDIESAIQAPAQLGDSAATQQAAAAAAGRPVTSYEDFCTYLQAKVRRSGRQCDIDFLNLKGKNRVLFSRAERCSTRK